MESPVNQLMRNKYRVLHHMGLARQKVAVIGALGLDQQSPHWPDARELLTALMNREAALADALGAISSWTGLDETAIRTELLGCYRTGLLEFHATDVCDLNCIECHYRVKSGATTPYSWVGEYMRTLSPRAIVVTGGGEPNRYRSEGKNLNDLIHLIHDVLPDVQIGMVNNNTAIPDGDWFNLLAWQRTSVDAENPITFKTIKRKDKYDACVANVYRLLDSDIPYVGVGFLYRRENIAEMKDFLIDWYGRWQAMDAAQREKFNVQFRPISPPIDEVGVYDIHSDLELATAKQVAAIRRYANGHADFAEFLSRATNFYSVVPHQGSLFLHEPLPFGHCYSALLHRVLRADGTEYPDFLLCNDARLALGNVRTAPDADNERLLIVLRSFFYYHRMSNMCNALACRQCWVSNLVETNWDTDIGALNLPDSYFF